MKLTSYDIGKVIRDLLRIAEVAMPSHLIRNDPRIRAGRDLLKAMNFTQDRPPVVPFIGEADPADPMTEHIAGLLGIRPPDPAIERALSEFMAGQGVGMDRSAALDHILRDWLVGHGYLAHDDAVDPYH